MATATLTLALLANHIATENEHSPLLTGSGSQKTRIELSLPIQASSRVWILRSSEDWNRFRSAAEFHSGSMMAEHDTAFDRKAVIIVRNTKFYNRQKILRATWHKDSTTLRLVISATRTARPITNRFHFVAISVPREITTVDISGQIYAIDDLPARSQREQAP